MDDAAPAIGTRAKTRIDAEEVERRRARVRRARAHGQIEGISLDHNADPIFDAYIRGEIEVTDMVPRLKAMCGIG
jgi:hypothetical protein